MPTKLPIYKLDDVRNEIYEYRKKGLQRGAYVGFPNFHEYYSMKKRSTTYIVAPAASGKSEFIKEMMINTAKYSDWVWVVFTPETGSPSDVFADILWAYLEKPIVSGIGFESASDAEIEAGMEFVSKHFLVFDVGMKDLDVATYFSVIKKLIESGQHIDATLIDPVTELDIYSGGASRDIELGRFLSSVRRLSGVYNIHSVLVFHTKHIDPKKYKMADGSQKRWYPPPTADDIAGGMQSSRKGYFILGLWRPHPDIINPETGEPYGKNVLQVEILKVKPKAVGKLGKFLFYYDPYTTRFKDEQGETARPQDSETEDGEFPF